MGTYHPIIKCDISAMLEELTKNITDQNNLCENDWHQYFLLLNN